MVIGILGFGVVGKSLIQLYASFPHMVRAVLSPWGDATTLTFAVWDERALTADEQLLTGAVQARVYDGKITTAANFAQICDVAFVAPGIDVPAREIPAERVLVELDFLHALTRLPTIAVTGSLGKTTVTQLLGSMLELDTCQNRDDSGMPHCGHLSGCLRERAAVAGNIGTGMLDLLPHQHLFSSIILELSSFQLELQRSWAPDLAVWTTFTHNHLDRHKTMEAYLFAKGGILRNQSAHQKALLPIELVTLDDWFTTLTQLRQQAQGTWVFWTDGAATPLMRHCATLLHGSLICCEAGHLIMYWPDGTMVTLREHIAEAIPAEGFWKNWICIFAALHLYGKNIAWITCADAQNAYQEAREVVGAHRMEWCGTVNGVDFYNDSKATVIQATFAALEALSRQERPIILLLGGLAKGANRQPLVDHVLAHSRIKQAIRFGPSCDDLAPISHVATLELAMDEVQKIARPGDIVLLSPSGASYDLFLHYRQRGDRFKALVAHLQKI